MIAILEYNNIPLWSFFKELSLKGSFQHEYKIDLEAEVMDAYYHSDKVLLKKIIQNLEKSGSTDKTDDILIVKGWLESLKDDEEEPDIEVRNALKDRVFNIPDLNKEKLTLFCNFMDFYDLDSNKPQFFFYKDMICFYKYLSSYHFNHNKDDLNKCQTIISNVKFAGMSEYGSELDKFLNNHI